MKNTKSAILLALCFLLSGCDGYIRTLYLRPPATPNPRWHIGKVEIKISGDDDVLGIVTSVAKDLKMTPSSNRDGAWSIRTNDYNSFVMSVSRDPAGYWVVGLMEWPGSGQSRESKIAESKILEMLKKTEPNQSPQPTTMLVTPDAAHQSRQAWSRLI